jgi:hypothetical protein
MTTLRQIINERDERNQDEVEQAFEKLMAYVEKYPDEFKECQREIQFLKQHNAKRTT